MKRSSGLALSFTLATLFMVALPVGDASAASEKLVHTFVPYSHGAVPSTYLVADGAGNFYGTTYEGGTQGLGTVFELMPNASGGWTEHVLYNFKGSRDGEYPYSGVTFDAAGNLYGATNLGGASGLGTVFELKPTARGSWSESVIYSFAGGADGARPQDGLVADAAGNLYGTTPMGGYLDGGTVTGSGTVFELRLSSGSWTLTTLHTFGSNLDGAMPSGRLIIDSGGNLYGTTVLGGASVTQGNYGTVFELSPVPGGWNESVIYNFTGGTDGGGSAAGLTLDMAGNLYGTAVVGGQKNSACLSGCGVVFELSPNGNGSWTQRVLYNFTAGKDGNGPHGGLIFDTAGNLYGTTFDGGGGCTFSLGCGTVFELAPTSAGQWEEKVLTSFAAALYVDATLIFDPAGNLYGTTTAGESANMGTFFKLTSSPSGQWSRSFPFMFRVYDGAQPNALLLDSAGNLYGTTRDGGVFGHGAVFKLIPNSKGGWASKLLYSFKGGADGASPNGLSFDNAGNLYGTASQGGNLTCDGGNGCGVVFKLEPNSNGGWTPNVLYVFGGFDGNEPMGGVIFDPAGNLYGTTYYGGNQCQLQSPGWPGCGTVFKLTPVTGGGWTETVLHNFSGDPDGAWPNAGVVIDAAGYLYGATTSGSVGGGVIFKLAPTATGLWTESILHSFNGYPVDGSGPDAGVILDSAGNIYGTTQAGGTGNCFSGYGCGTVFELSPSSGNQWTESILVNFSPSGSDGDGPQGLSFDGAGDLYGLTSSGGSSACSGGCGAIYKLLPASGGQWTETVFHTFTGPPKDGSLGVALILDAAGNVYAVGGGGSASEGVIVEVMP